MITGLLLVGAITACGSPARTASSVAPAPVLPAAELEDARQFRVRFGLRADESWIRAVAADPTAQQGLVDFGVPLMPFERSDLEERRTDVDLLTQINGYGSMFPDSYAGAYVDLRASQAFVASFKTDSDRHRIALANLLPVGARVDVRDVDWSTTELEAFVEIVTAEEAWFETIGVRFASAGRAITEDHVYVKFQGRPEAVRLIEEHFGDPTWLVADRQGPLPWQGPRGDLVIAVRDEAGAPVPGLWCEFVSEDPEAAEGGEDIFGTGDDGRCVLRNLPAVAYQITLHRFVDDDHYEPIKTFRVVLAPGGTTIPMDVPAP